MSTDTNGRGDLTDRVAKLEWQIENTDRRLEKGAQTFSDLRGEAKTIREECSPKPTPTWKIITVGVTCVVLLAGWVWQAAKYPNRDEFDAVRSEVGSLKVDQVRLQKDVEAIRTSQVRIENGISEIQKDIRSQIVNSLPDPPKRRK